MYRIYAPWDGAGVRDELRARVDDGTFDPARSPRVIDLGCGTGANVVYLAQQGFDAWGVDFSRVALAKAAARALDADVAERCRFVAGDLTASSIPEVDGTFDLLIDFGVLDDLKGAARRAMAATIVRLSHSGSLFLLWCFYAPVASLPRFSFTGPSRFTPTLEPGEERELFGASFDITPGPTPRASIPAACFLMRRR